MESTIRPFVRKSLEINDLFLEVFNDKLGLAAGTLLEKHKTEEFSGSEARIIRNKPTSSTTKQAIVSHTDFGSLVSLTLGSCEESVYNYRLISHSSTTGWEDYKYSSQVRKHGNMSRYTHVAISSNCASSH